MQFSFIEVTGGTLIATSQVAYLSVNANLNGHNVIVETVLGHQWIYATCEEEDEAFSVMHKLAKSIGPVFSAD